ncbi:aminopeptidase Ey-like [Acipenser ruthenus]|uniref:aminopeptidase Ey-like n=1 Tax=Acipenser ruthenus TaxID=7906 RepID=UPI00145ACC72|nr:aminopeptidase Ey-like [Acipenser ruthenus]XP_058851582.1 aminopeptidase Ey-like [Acipenser ruthenus]
MGKGFYISKTLAVVGILLAAASIATIIALAVVYSNEKAKNIESVTPTGDPATTGDPAPTKPSSTTSPPQEPWNKVRLPDSLKPLDYNVTLWPRLTPNTDSVYIFTGESTVIFECVKATSLILIHSKKLNLTESLQLSGYAGSTPPAITASWMEKETEFLVIQLDSNLEAGKTYSLFTKFVGELADDLAGFYRSEYMEDGVKKIVATTQMQATDARKSFPCFDEPAMKARFNITLIHDPDRVALSNSPVQMTTQETLGGKLMNITVFQPTAKMSTYLLAFIVSDFEFIENMSGNVLIRIWARQKAIAQGQGDYALNVTGPILKYFESYYNTTYPLPKSDQIALPDFNAGAMENWGLITYRETALLYDPHVSSTSNKERVVTVIAHELAHQWFGNLVTVRWWNDLWLNEGFASYVEYLGADYAEPSWNIKDLMVLNDVHRVFAVDALASSHPLSSKEDEINTPAEISELFDAISYSKGASVLRMLSVFLTEDVFVKGLRTYLNEFQYNNTVYQDLWDHLQRAVDSSGVSLPHKVEDIMNRWTLQMGFPVVTINTMTGQVTQKHFLVDPDSVVNRTSPFNYIWYVPISWTKLENAQPQYWLDQTTGTNDNMKITGTDWLLANINCTGYFRVNYDRENWNKLLQQMESGYTVIPVINRAQLIDDAFNLARAGYIPTTLALDTTKYLSKDREYMPWESAIDNLGYFSLMFDRTEVNGPMQAYLRKQVTPLFDYYENLTSNWTALPPGHTQQYNQINAVSVACKNGVKKCQELASSLYQEWMDNPSVNPIEPNLRTSIYCSAISTGGAAEWDFGWEMFKNATIATEADKLRSALSCATQPWILNRYLEYSLQADKIRKQDATSTIVYIAGNVVGQSLAWDFIRSQWNTIFNQYGGGSFSFSSLINGVTQRFSSEFELKQLEQFQKDNAEVGFGSGTRALEQALERTRANIKWLSENKASVLDWFKRESL